MMVLGGLTLFGPFGTDAFLPAIPRITTDMAAAPGAVQLTLTGFSFGMAAGQLIAGPLSDAIGRRRPLMVGSTILLFSSVLAASAPNLTVLIAACCCTGLSASVGTVVARAMIADVSTGPELMRSYAALGTLTSLGPVLGPTGGVVLMTTLGWRGIFVGLAVAAATVLLGIARHVPETLPPQRRTRGGLRALASNARSTFRSRAFLAGLTVICFGFAGLFAYISASATVIQSLMGFSAFSYSVIFAVNGLGLVGCGLLCVRLSGRWTARQLMCLGLVVESTGAVLIVVDALTREVDPVVTLPGMFLVASSMGLLFGPATSSALSQLQTSAGTVLAIIGALQFVAAGFVAPLVGIGSGTISFAIVCGGCVLVAWIGFTVWRPRRGTEAATTTSAGSGHPPSGPATT